MILPLEIPMRSWLLPLVLAPAVAVALSAAASSAVPPAPPAPEKVPVAGSDRYRVRYTDGALSVNDWCPVGNRALGASQTPLYVNGRPVGFC